MKSESFRKAASAGLLALTLPIQAVELPMPEKLSADIGAPEQALEVIEPHESSPGHETRVKYRGYAMVPILNRLFGERWKSADTEVVFFGQDGYRSGIAADRFRAGTAWLAFARADDTPFTVANPRQHKSSMVLGPYYLVWDNLRDPMARAEAEYGWPYQVVKIELATPADYAAAQPLDAEPAVAEGFGYVKKYCLGCHRIAGIGGKKLPGDLRELSRTLKDEDLKTWITEPGNMRPYTTMPPVNIMLPEVERNHIADRIVRYLRVVGAGTKR